MFASAVPDIDRVSLCSSGQEDDANLSVAPKYDFPEYYDNSRFDRIILVKVQSLRDMCWLTVITGTK